MDALKPFYLRYVMRFRPDHVPPSDMRQLFNFVAFTSESGLLVVAFFTGDRFAFGTCEFGLLIIALLLVFADKSMAFGTL
jgi:hypothetical protein